MSRRLKELIVAELAERHRGVDSCVVVGYQGLTAEEANGLRRALAEQRFRMEVVKNSMAVRAFGQTGLEALSRFLDGPSAIVRGEGEMPTLCRTLAAWAKANGKLDLRGGLMAGEPLGREQVQALASMPPLETLYAQILAGVRGPILQLAWAVQSIGRGLACALEGVRAKKEESGGPPPAGSASG